MHYLWFGLGQIPKRFHQVNRVVLPLVTELKTVMDLPQSFFPFPHCDSCVEQLLTITPTHLQLTEIRKLQLADDIVNQVSFLHPLSCTSYISLVLGSCPSRFAQDLGSSSCDSLCEILFFWNRCLFVPNFFFQPVNFGEEGKHSIAIRAFISNDFMTGQAAVPGKDIPLQL